jgi:peptidase M28-like protein/PA domain-containing protein
VPCPPRPWLLAALAAVALGAPAGCGGGSGGAGESDGSGAVAGAPGGPGGDGATMSAGTTPAPAAGGRAGGDASDPWTHLRALAATATANRGTRAAGTPGGVATEDLVAARLKQAGWTVRFARVTFPFFAERRPPLVVLPGGRRLATGTDVRTLAYSAGGNARGAVRVVGGDRTDAGCRDGDWDGFPRGRIALVRRGVCPFAAKARGAQRAGAAAVVVEDRDADARRGPVSGTLGAPGIRIPVVAVDGAAGDALAGADGPVRVRVDAVSARRAARDVVAELPGTAGDRVVMAGAHLDSVPAGPGINDDGSGVATLLALADRFARAPRSRDTLRLGFWTAEELGLYGSRAYVRGLSAAERRRVRSYVNLDMVGSPNAVLETYGSGATDAALRRALDARGPAPSASSIGGASDHASFQRAGIEVGGVFTGASERVGATAARRYGARAGRPADPCYHRACDTLANVDRAMLERVADATEQAIRSLAG